MKARVRIVSLAVAMLIVGGIVGYVAGTRTAVGFIAGTKTTDTELAGLVRQQALVHAAGEASIYSQVLRSLREGDEQCAINRLETLLDYSVIHFGEYYAPEYDEQLPWVGHAFHCALDYRTIYPHRPSSDWSAKRYEAALALKTRDN